MATAMPQVAGSFKGSRASGDLEYRYRFIRYIEKLEGIVVHPGSQQ
jgi:hypothetical protein